MQWQVNERKLELLKVWNKGGVMGSHRIGMMGHMV
jgi:hypothetical protein